MIISGLAGPARSPWPIRLRYLLGYLGTVILVLATLLIAPLYHVGIAHFLSCTFQFPFQHGRALEDNHFFYNFTWEGLEVQPGIWNLRHIFEPLFTFILVPVICAIIFIRLLRSDRGYIWRHRRIVVTAAILLCSYISVLPSPTTIRVAPDASLAFVVLVWYLRQYVSSFRLIVVAMLAISLPLALYRLRPRDIATLNTFGGRIAAAPAEAEYDDLRWRTEHVRPGTYFLSTDYGDYFPIGVRNPMPCGFLTNTPFTPAWQVEETTRRLMEYKVQYIKWNANELDVTHPAADPGDNLNPLRDYIRTRYRPLFTTGGSIYFEYVGDTRERIVAQK